MRLFKENRSHETPKLMSVKNSMTDELKIMYEKTWAPAFYTNIFSRINEKLFKVLFSDKISRSNTPVNIYVSLEILKELFGLSDQELLRRFHFDNLFILAMGLNEIGEITISERAFYYMRGRVVKYEEETGINLLDKVFANFKDDIIKKLGLSKKIKRIDSTLIGSNIRRLNRIKLLLETLTCFLKKLDDNDFLKLSKEIREFKKINVENFVYSLNNDDSKLKIKEIAEYLYKIKVLFENDNIKESDSYKILSRLVSEQIDISGDGKKVELKNAKDLSSSSLQSPHDPDATYRKKGNQAAQGYSISVAETCDPENEVQIITDVIVEENNIDDSKILENNFEKIMEDETEEIITDGAYLNNNVQDKLSKSQKNIVTTAIKGRKPVDNKLSTTEFEIKNKKIIKCPRGMSPTEQEFKDKKIIAKFSRESCAGCQLNCLIRKNKRKDHVLELQESKIFSDIQREKYNDRDYLRKCRLRPAVEGTMFQMKLHLRNGKSKYRGKIKVRFSSILRSIAINFKRMHAYEQKIMTYKCIFEAILQIKGIFSKIFFVQLKSV